MIGGNDFLDPSLQKKKRFKDYKYFPNHLDKWFTIYIL